jgi:probable F420-dependent oxidoreductase
MRYGTMLSQAEIGNNPDDIRRYVMALDDAGVDFLTSPEHVIGGHPDRLRDGEVVHTYDKPYHEPFVLFGFIAAITRRIELGTSILILPQRQTALVAKQAAELDLLSGGRLRLGIGSGRNWMEYEALDADFSTRGRRMEEQVEVLRRLWTEELVTFKGRWHNLDRMGLNPMPVQRPIPIWMGSFVGAVVEKVIERIGRVADGWMCQMQPGDELTAVAYRLRSYAAAAGRDADALGIECVARVRPGDDPASWVRAAEAFRTAGATHLKAIPMGFGSPNEMLDATLAWHRAVSA